MRRGHFVLNEVKILLQMQGATLAAEKGVQVSR